MSTRIDIIPELSEEQYKYEVRITDEALQCLDDSVISLQFGSSNNLVKFYVDRKLSIDECRIILEKLEHIAGEKGSISIFTTGRNFNDLMKVIGTREKSNHYEMHIDDNDIRSIIDINNIICGLNFSRIVCDCYFSDRYLMNFNFGDFLALIKISECKFDRDRIYHMRYIYETVWSRLIPQDHYAINNLTSFEKAEIILDYIKKNFKLVDNSMSDDLIETFNTRTGTNYSLSLLANLLLDNYLAQVDCRVVKGTYLGNGIESLIVTKHDGNYYGHSLINDYRFTDLTSKGYTEGIITLESPHSYRDDFILNVGSYNALDEIDYFNLLSVLDVKRKAFELPTSLNNIQLQDAYSIEYNEKRVDYKNPSLSTLLRFEHHHRLPNQQKFLSSQFVKGKSFFRNNLAHTFRGNRKEN